MDDGRSSASSFVATTANDCEDESNSTQKFFGSFSEEPRMELHKKRTTGNWISGFRDLKDFSGFLGFLGFSGFLFSFGEIFWCGLFFG